MRIISGQNGNQKFFNNGNVKAISKIKSNITKKLNFARLLIAFVLVSCLCVSYSLVSSQASTSDFLFDAKSSNMISQKRVIRDENNYFSKQVLFSPFTTGVCESLPGGVIEVEGTGGSGTQPTGYATLAAAFAAINTGVHTGTIVIDVCGDTSEGTSSATLNASGTGSASYTSITISPAGGSARTISGTTTAGNPLIDLNGADNVTIDGLNTGGNALTITNTTVGSGSTIRFINDATNNTISNSTINGSENSTASGTIFFSTTTGTTGNDGNIINNNNIGPAGASLPFNGIYALGSTTSTAVNNSGIQITNNRIFDFFAPAAADAGILVAAGNTDWTITGNSLYQSATRTMTSAATDFGIQINNTSGNNFIVSNNFIGGSMVNAGGTAWTIAGSIANRFRAISLNVGSTTASSVQGNTIANFSFTSNSSSTTIGGPWTGIYLGAGNANIGTTTGNTIGSGTGTGSINISIVTNSGSISSGIFSDASPTTTSISNNVIGSISFGASTISQGFQGIATTTASSGGMTISGNTIGSTTTANSININTGATSTTNQIFRGINNTISTVGVSITNNTIANINNNYLPSSATSTSTILVGITSSSGISTVTGNTIRNMTTAANHTGTTSNAPVIGISISNSTAGHTISQNTIHSLSETHATAAINIYGIYYAGSISGTNIVERNFIHSLSVSSAGSAIMRGIYAFNGSTSYRNNMIRLGIDAAGNSLTSGTLAIEGIRMDTLSTAVNNIYFNSVFIGGTGVTTGTANSTAYIRITTETTSDIRNNIFVNNRSNSTGTGKHYLINLNASSGVTSNFNVFNQTGTGAVFGVVGVTDSTSFANWKTNTSQDNNSFFSDPMFIASTGTSSTVDLHINPAVTTVVEGNGVLISPPTDDFDGQTRASLTPVDIGADAGNFMGIDLAPPIISYSVLGNTSSTSNRVLGVTITDVTGVATGGNAPRIYFNKNAGMYSSTACMLSGGTINNGTWDCTIDYSIIGGVVATDVIRYFVVAQDTPGNLASNPSAGFAGTDVNNVTTPPTTPNQYTVVPSISGDKTVGAGGDYATLTAAVAALNNAEITGAVTLTLTDASYTSPAETFPLVINANAGSSMTNTVTIKPAIGVSPTISGSSSGCIISFNGADYMTIDGSNTAMGTTRDLTVTNTNSGTSTAVVCIQTATGPNGATNNTVKNVNVVGNSNTTTLFGIFSGSSTIALSSTGNGNNNNTIQNNNISKTQYGIFSQGLSAVAKNSGNVIKQNLINTVSPNNVAKGGIITGFENNLQITQNTVSEIAQTSSPDVFGITLGIQGISTSTFTGNEVTNATVTKNVVGSIRNTGTFSACGICVAPATSGTNQISNNMVSGVSANGTSGDFSVGILIGGGAGSTTHIYFNSVSMSGTQTGGSDKSFALAVGGSNPIVVIRNNILYNTQNNGSGNNYGVGFGYSTFTNLTSSNNVFFVTSPSAIHFVGGTGSISSPTNQAALANLQTATGQDANSIAGDPKFISTTNLHINTTMTTPVESAGVPIAGITDDIDLDIRNASTPDIGADEGTFIAPVSNDVQATAFIDPTNGSSKIADVAFSPQASFTNNGTVNQTNVPVRYRICTDGSCTTELYNQTTTIAILNSTSTATATFASATLSAGTYTIKAKAELVGDTVPANDEITGTLNVLPPFNGTYTVGSGGNYTSLTNNGGIFEAINSLGATGSITINITSDLTGETGTHSLNEIAGGHSVLIVPSGGPRMITGSNTGALIKLNGADNVTIDGSTPSSFAEVVGGTASLRELTIQNTNTGTSAWVIAVQSGTNGAQNNRLQNLNVIGQDPLTTLGGISLGGNTPGTVGTDNDNNRVVNCSVRRAVFGIYSAGQNTTNPNTGTLIKENDLSGTGADRIRRIGIVVFNEDGIDISENIVGGLDTNESADAVGIGVGTQSISSTNVTGGGVTNATVARNRINGVNSNSASGFSSVGIALALGSGTNSIRNNMITGVIGNATSPDLVAGIYVVGSPGSSTSLHNNSVAMTGDRGTTASQMPSFAVAVTGIDPGVQFVNNIFYTTQTSGGGTNAKSYAVGLATTTFLNLLSNHNDFWSTGANDGGFRTGSLGAGAGTDYADLTAWQTAITDDANSFELDPLFTSSTDLHLQGTSPILSGGMTLGTVTVDFDNDPRPASNPDIGADEIVEGQGGTFPSGTFYNALASGFNTLAGDVTIAGVLTLGGQLMGNGFTVTVSCNASVAGASGSNFINGNVRKDFCSTGSFQFPLGSGLPPFTGNSTEGVNQFTPVTANVTALGQNPSSLVATVTQGTAPATPPLNPSVTLNRYWSLTEIGDVTADLSFFYLESDVNGTEANYNIYRIVGSGSPFVFPSIKQSPCGSASPCIDTTNNILFIGGVRNFSNWLAGGLAPTTSIAEIGGQIRTANGQPIVGAFMTSRNLSNGQTLTARTDSTGHYNFGGQIAAQDYAVAPVLNGYRFEPNQKIVSLNGNRTDVDFIAIETIRNPSNDYDGDGIADLAVFRPSEGNWYIWQSSTNSLTVENWGVASDRIVPADYDGDGRMDLAVYRPSEGNWYIKESFNGRTRVERWGLATDRVVPADYDGDGRTDIAVYRQSNNVWYIKRSSDGTVQYETLSQQVTKPVIGDFDGDRRADIAGVVNTVSDGQMSFVVKGSRTNTVTTESWGLGNDYVMYGDYDGDGRTDYTVFRQSDGIWYVKTSSSTIIHQWGISTDEPLNGDYDGNGVSDYVVYRVENGHGFFYILGNDGQYRIHQFGLAGDIPIGRDVIR